MDYFSRRSRENGEGYTIFLGAGAYYHYRPVIIDSLISRGEFLTAYTPYQAEISQGTLQSIFEFQTMICELTGMEVANASMYDGSTAAAEAVMMAVRLTGEAKRSCARTRASGVPRGARHVCDSIRECRFRTRITATTAALNLKELEAAITPKPRACCCNRRTSSALIEDVDAVAEIAHKNGAMLVVSIAEAVSLGIVEPPTRLTSSPWKRSLSVFLWDSAVPMRGDRYPREDIVRQMPGRLVGQTVDKQGKRGFVLTLSTREQHIRREKATSNICTNQAWSR